MAGSFIWSITFTDIFSQWTENRAVWNKDSTDVLREVKDLEESLAFELLGFDVDNGSEFLTFHLWRYLLDRPRPVPMTRSRAYRKNDQAHVEQKNWTHVRPAPGATGVAPLDQRPLSHLGIVPQLLLSDAQVAPKDPRRFKDSAQILHAANAISKAPI